MIFEGEIYESLKPYEKNGQEQIETKENHASNCIY